MEIRQKIEQIIEDTLAELKKWDSPLHCNERYLHHVFSRRIQDICPVSFSSDCGLHPEWATYVKGKREYARYVCQDRKYCPAEENGSSGFIDFAVGKANSPEYAIEFKMSKNFNKEGIIYDYMKLFDKRNCFSEVFSVVVYYGHKSHSKQCEPEKLNQCITETKERLDDNFDDVRLHQFHVLEICKGEIISHLYSSDDLTFSVIRP